AARQTDHWFRLNLHEASRATAAAARRLTGRRTAAVPRAAHRERLIRYQSSRIASDPQSRWAAVEGHRGMPDSKRRSAAIAQAVELPIATAGCFSSDTFAATLKTCGDSAPHPSATPAFLEAQHGETTQARRNPY